LRRVASFTQPKQQLRAADLICLQAGIGTLIPRINDATTEFPWPTIQ
jgi:hypothetical protein